RRSVPPSRLLLRGCRRRLRPRHRGGSSRKPALTGGLHDGFRQGGIEQRAASEPGYAQPGLAETELKGGFGDGEWLGADELQISCAVGQPGLWGGDQDDIL